MTDDWTNAEASVIPSSGPQAVMDNPTAEPPPEPQETAEVVPETTSEPEAPEPQRFEDMSPEQLQKANAGLLENLKSLRSEMKRQRVQNAERDRVLQERVDLLFNANQQQQQQEPAPDPETDPVGNLRWQQDQYARAQQQQLNAIQQQLQMRNQADTGQQELDYISQQEAAYLQGNQQVGTEQYENALEHVRGAMRTYYKARGVPEEYMEAAIAEEERGFARSAIQQGTNPAEARVDFARSLGWNPPATPHVPGEVPQGSEEPKAPSNTLEFKKGGVEAAKSLSEVQGTSGKRRITLEDLYNAPPELFDKIRKNQATWDEINVKGEILI